MDAIFAFYQRPLDAEFLSAIRHPARKSVTTGAWCQMMKTTRFARMPLISSPTKLLTSNTTTSWEITRSLMASYYENTNTYAIVFE
jgi:hypothetical protein